MAIVEGKIETKEVGAINSFSDTRPSQSAEKRFHILNTLFAQFI